MERPRRLLYLTLIASLRLMHRYGCHKLGHAQNIEYELIFHNSLLTL